MSAGQIDALINVVRKMMEDHEEHFLLKSHKDLDELWSDATSKYAPVCPFSLSLLQCLTLKCPKQFESNKIRVPYRESIRTYDIWNRSLKDWLTNVLDDDYLGDVIQLDARKLEKFDGEKWVRFIHQPWTADHMWNIQVHYLC